MSRGCSGFKVLIYYWDERDGPNFHGWWFGPKARTVALVVFSSFRTKGPTMRRRSRIFDLGIYPYKSTKSYISIGKYTIQLVLWGSNWRYTPSEIPMWQNDIPCTKNGGTEPYFRPFLGVGFPYKPLHIQLI